MEKKGGYQRFDGRAWLIKQVHKRTSDKLKENGIEASTHSVIYKTEYARQMALFRAERAEIKRRKKEKHLEREQKRMNGGRSGAK